RRSDRAPRVSASWPARPRPPMPHAEPRRRRRPRSRRSWPRRDQPSPRAPPWAEYDPAPRRHLARPVLISDRPGDAEEDVGTVEDRWPLEFECDRVGHFQTSFGTWPAYRIRITLWPKSAVAPNIKGQPPSITVMPCCLPYSVAVGDTLPAPGPRCIQTCLIPSSAHSRIVSSARSGRVPMTTASTPPGID